MASPGEILAEELAARHWSQADFAQILDRPAQFVSEVITGKKEITRESAAQIGAATKQTASYWLDLQNRYLLRQNAQDKDRKQDLDDVALRARMNELAPVAHLRKRGYLTASTLQGQRQELEELFQISSINDDPGFPIAARRVNVAEKLTPTQLAWLACARQAAKRLAVGPFDAAALRVLATGLSRIARTPRDFRSLPARFAAIGVRLVYVEAFPSSKLDGASFLLDAPDSYVIALSGRGKRLDKVLFTLLHEIAHLVAGHVTPDRMILDEDDATNQEEKQANQLASDWAIPTALDPTPMTVRREWVERQATLRGIHPLVVIGQLQHTGDLDWRSALTRDAATVVEELESWNS
jgi:HTH-type transcriptional regulator/antitoxin HigA